MKGRCIAISYGSNVIYLFITSGILSTLKCVVYETFYTLIQLYICYYQAKQNAFLYWLLMR